MTSENRSQRTFFAVTIVTILAIVLVITAYAAYINTFQGGDVTIGTGATGAVTYSSDGTNWAGTLSPGSAEASWYARLSINGGQYSGRDVTIDWQLELKTGDGTTDWLAVGSSTRTTMSLPAGDQVVYATGDGGSTGNLDWGSIVTDQGVYRVVATVNSV